MNDDGWRLVAKLEEIPIGEGKAVDVEGRKVALLRHGETLHAVDDSCPHMRASLAEGFLHADTVTCPLHAWGFSLDTGVCIAVPGASISIHEIEDRKGRIWVRLKGHPAA